MPKKLYEYQGESHSIPEWAAKYGIKSKTLYVRIQLGWSMEKALTTSPDEYRKPKASSKIQTWERFAKKTAHLYQDQDPEEEN